MSNYQSTIVENVMANQAIKKRGKLLAKPVADIDWQRIDLCERLSQSMRNLNIFAT